MKNKLICRDFSSCCCQKYFFYQLFDVFLIIWRKYSYLFRNKSKTKVMTYLSHASETLVLEFLIQRYMHVIWFQLTKSQTRTSSSLAQPCCTIRKITITYLHLHFCLPEICSVISDTSIKKKKFLKFTFIDIMIAYIYRSHCDVAMWNSQPKPLGVSITSNSYHCFVSTSYLFQLFWLCISLYLL